MKCNSKTVDNVIVLSLSGSLVYTYLAEVRDTAKEEITKSETSNVLLNLSNVSKIDSSGIGFIVSMYKSVLWRKGVFAILNPNEDVKEAIDLVGLMRLFKIFEDEETALKHF